MARILVIDDDPAVRRAMGLLLATRGHEARLAEGGETAIKVLETAAFDLAIIDVFMPYMDGLETADTIRRMRPAMPIVMASGFFPAHAQRRSGSFHELALAHGATATLTKPFRAGELLSCIARCLEQAVAAPPISPAGAPCRVPN